LVILIVAKEKMVGWYHSGPKLRGSDLMINELFKQYNPNPVLVIVDVKPTNISLPTDAYFSVEQVHNVSMINQDGTATTRTFESVASVIEAEEAEEIGVEHLLRDIKDTSVGSLSTNIQNQLLSLKGLDQNLKEVAEYLEKVTNGDLPVNHKILYYLQDLLNMLPNIGKDVEVVNAKTNDEMLVIYLGSMIRAVLALHNLIENKGMLREIEVGETSVKPAPVPA
jgi:26S proteasome regulatory subunit N8